MSPSTNNPSRFIVAGGFIKEDVAPTCAGFQGKVFLETKKLPRNELLQISKSVMNAVWAQPLTTKPKPSPVIECIADLIAALESGWSFNANEGDYIFTVFGDIRPIAREGAIVGVGTRAPDGSFIRDGRDLVAWRERRWNTMRGPEFMKDLAKQQPLRAV